jgi:hypothetical protein
MAWSPSSEAARQVRRVRRRRWRQICDSGVTILLGFRFGPSALYADSLAELVQNLVRELQLLELALLDASLEALEACTELVHAVLKRGHFLPLGKPSKHCRTPKTRSAPHPNGWGKPTHS